LSKIKDGKRCLPKRISIEYNQIRKALNKEKREKTKIKKQYQEDFKKYDKKQKEWMRIQGKGKVFKADVELDQIMTYYRIGLASLMAYFAKRFLGQATMDPSKLITSIFHLTGTIKQNQKIRRIKLDYNKQDPKLMEKLQSAINKINDLRVIGPHGRTMEFVLSSPD
jgi:hypothetical protein